MGTRGWWEMRSGWNIPHTFDAVKIRYQDSFFGVDLFAANLVYVDEDHFETSYSQDTLSGAYFDFPGISTRNINEAYLFARNVSRGIVTDDWSQVPAPFRFTGAAGHLHSRIPP